jgi:hypothetical protein
MTTGGRLIWSVDANVNLSYNVTNCSAGDETVAVSFTGTGTSLSIPLQEAPCSTTASWSAGTFTIKPGSTQGFSTFVPQLTCPFDQQQDEIQAVFSDATSGAMLATTGTFIQRLPANLAVRGGPAG